MKSIATVWLIARIIYIISHIFFLAFFQCNCCLVWWTSGFVRQVKVNASHCCQLASERHTTNLNKQYFFDHQCGNSFAGKFIITRVWLMCRGFAIVWLFVFGFFFHLFGRNIFGAMWKTKKKIRKRNSNSEMQR